MARNWGRWTFNLTASVILILLISTSCLILFLTSHGPFARAPRFSPPPLPTRAFFITTEGRHASNWTSYTVNEIMRRKTLLNIERMDYVYPKYDNEFGDIKGAPGVNAILAMAHYNIWRAIIDQNIDSAWVFEDDVVFHDDFETLLPMYWEQVPKNYEVVYLGHSPMGGNQPSCQVTAADMAQDPETDPRYKRHPLKLIQVRDEVYCTHAMAVSAAGAHRMVSAMRGNMRTTIIAGRLPYHTEINSDLFLEHLHRYHVSREDKLKWIVFDPTVKYLSKWAGLTWCRMAPFEERASNCTCETCLAGDPGVPLQLPLYATGLIFHNFCKIKPSHLEVWRERILALTAAGWVNPDPIHGKRVAKTPHVYWTEKPPPEGATAGAGSGRRLLT